MWSGLSTGSKWSKNFKSVLLRPTYCKSQSHDNAGTKQQEQPGGGEEAGTSAGSHELGVCQGSHPPFYNVIWQMNTFPPDYDVTLSIFNFSPIANKYEE